MPVSRPRPPQRQPKTKSIPEIAPAEPLAVRARIPAEYGTPSHDRDLLPWKHVRERMTKSERYWLCSISPQGSPHAVPIDGIWLDDHLYFGGSVETRWSRNLRANPAATLHLENAMDVLVLHGEAREFLASDHALAVRLAAASKKKYGYGFSPEQMRKTPGMFRFSPRRVLAWTNIQKDPTRWDLPAEGSAS